MVTLYYWYMLILMGIMGYLGVSYSVLKDPVWHVSLKIILGLIAIWGGTTVPE